MFFHTVPPANTLVRWVNENAFAPIVQARPCPTFGRPVHPGFPHRLRPGTSPHALRIPSRDGHPALRVLRLPGQRGFIPAFGYGTPHLSTRGTLTLLNNALLSAHYKPLRHPMPPGPSLAGLRLVIADHVMGLPVLRALSLVYMPSPIPRRSDWVPRLLTSPAVSAFPDSDSGSAHASSFSRLARRSLPLRPAHSHRHRIS